MAGFSDCAGGTLVNEPLDLRIQPPSDDNGNVWVMTLSYKDLLTGLVEYVNNSSADLEDVVAAYCLIVYGA